MISWFDACTMDRDGSCANEMFLQFKFEIGATHQAEEAGEVECVERTRGRNLGREVQRTLIEDLI